MSKYPYWSVQVTFHERVLGERFAHAEVTGNFARREDAVALLAFYNGPEVLTRTLWRVEKGSNASGFNVDSVFDEKHGLPPLPNGAVAG